LPDENKEVVAFTIRLPRHLSEIIRERARRNRRSLNQEITWLLEQTLQSLESSPEPGSAGGRSSDWDYDAPQRPTLGPSRRVGEEVWRWRH